MPHDGDRRVGARWSAADRPLPGHRLRIVGEDGRPLPRAARRRDRPGRSVGHAGLLQGATRSPRETIRDGWLHTGDLGYLSDGELFVCGRVKDVIIVNGRKYHPQDLEWAVDDLAGVRRGRVVAFGAAERGRRRSRRHRRRAERHGAGRRADRRDSPARSAICSACYVDDVVLVPSGTVGADDERQGAARGDQGAVRARRARDGGRRPTAGLQA